MSAERTKQTHKPCYDVNKILLPIFLSKENQHYLLSINSLLMIVPVCSYFVCATWKYYCCWLPFVWWTFLFFFIFSLVKTYFFLFEKFKFEMNFEFYAEQKRQKFSQFSFRHATVTFLQQENTHIRSKTIKNLLPDRKVVVFSLLIFSRYFFQCIFHVN